MSVTAKPLSDAGERIDFSDWEFGESTRMNKLIAGAVEEAMVSALVTDYDDYPQGVHVQFPWQWSDLKPSQRSQNDPLNDPTVIYITLPFSSNDDRDPAWRVRLTELIIDAMDSWVTYDETQRILLNERSRPRLTRFVEQLEADAAFARKLLTEAVLVDEDGQAIEDQ